MGSQKWIECQEKKTKKLDSTKENTMYWEAFKDSKFPDNTKHGSMVQYKCTIFQVMEFIEKDIITITLQDIEDYLLTQEEKVKNNKESHIKGLLTFIITNNLNDAVNRVQKDIILYLIPSKFKELVNTVLSKGANIKPQNLM